MSPAEQPTESAQTRGWVAAGNPDTAAAAIAAFEMGGNAVDAAVAAGLASFVCEPLLASAGGGGLMLLAGAAGGTHCLDFFPHAPGLGRPAHARGGSDFAAVDVDFGSVQQRFHVGRASACAPCVLPAFAQAVQRHGRLPLAALVEPAVELARKGVAIGPSGAEVFALLWPIVSRDPNTLRALFGTDTPRGPQELSAATVVQNPRFADHLEAWARRGGGRRPDEDAALLACVGVEVGGSLTKADLDAAQPRWCDPEPLRLGPWELSTCPLPGGVAVASMAARLAQVPADSPAQELALALAQAGVHADRERLGARPRGSTTHISTLDADGHVVSMTLSNGEGCGHIDASTGVLINNFMGEADLNPRGHFAHEAGAPLPTMMSPCIARAPGRLMAFGSGGANRIRSAVTRVFDAVAHRGLDLEAAIMAGRVHAEGDEVWFERGGWSEAASVESSLRDAYSLAHGFNDRAFFFGGVHAVALGPEGVQAFGDPRRAGATAQT